MALNPIISPIQFLSKLEALFKAHANAKEAEGMQKYMKNLFPFLGIKKPLRKELTKELYKEIKTCVNEAWLIKTIDLLWKKPEREFQYVALELMQRFAPKHLTASAWPSVEKWLIKKSWWDSVDAISVYAVAPMVQNFPEVKKQVKRYISHKNFWLKRVAIIHQLPYYEKTDEAFLWEACLKNADDKEFFIRKAIGWALRQYSRSNAKAVKTFVEANRDKLSPLSIREALKHH
jgi:3-methyladenine DNA glycosylase AlkD